MKKYSFFHRFPMKVGAPVLVAVCLSMSGTAMGAEAKADPNAKQTAAKPAANAEAKPAPQKTLSAAEKMYQDIQMQRNKDVEAILQQLQEIDKLNDQSKYAEALKELGKLQKKFEESMTVVNGEKKPSMYLEEVWREYKKRFDEICTKTGEMYFQKAKKLYSAALRGGNSLEGSEKAKQAKDTATEAKSLYYTGKFQNEQGSDQASVDAAITKNNRDFSIRVEQLKAACDKIIVASDFRSKSDISYSDPNKQNRDEDISVLYKQAEKLYRAKQYTKSRDLCEKIFLLDPFNQDAIRLLDKVYTKLYFYAELRSYNEMLRHDAETIWSYVPSISDGAHREVRVISRTSSDPLLEKLASWKIDVDFKDYDIVSAINKIREKSKEVDPQHIGVNFLPQGLEGVNKLITLQLNNTPITIVLNYLCKKAGIKWSTDKEMFVIVGTRIDDYETREIPLRNNVYLSITGKSAEDLNKESAKGTVWGEGGIAAGVEANTKKRAKISDEDLRKFFVERGIPFDQYSAIAYNSRQHLLSVTNTRENLMKLEILVRELDVENPLILIESKILEISLHDEEELGFDWTMNIMSNSDRWSFTMNSPLRSAEKALNISHDVVVNHLNIVPNLNIGDGAKLNVYLTVTAVDRTDRVEILSTPKVVTTNGTEATIKMVDKKYFPESWNEPDTSNVNGTSMEFSPSYPEFGDATDVGIAFTVTPTISSNNKMITLQLQPSISDHTGWSDYSYDVIMDRTTTTEATESEEGIPTGESKIKSGSGSKSKVTMIMPKISKREVITNVKVFDGQTVTIGGITRDEQMSMDDRFPILGDIPIFGRFFSKTASKTDRVNLLISVTTRLISGDGMPCNNNPPNGVPDFRR